MASFSISDCIILIVIGYVVGVILHEVSLLLDVKLFCNKAFGGLPRRIFLLKDSYRKIFADDISYYNALQVRDYIIKTVKLNDWIKKEQYKEEELNPFIYSSCLNMSEMKGISWKTDKMSAICDLC